MIGIYIQALIINRNYGKYAISALLVNLAIDFLIR